MADRIQLRRGTSSTWQSLNPILGQGEPGFEIDTGKLKIGDGLKAWNALEYIVGDGSGGGAVSFGDASSSAKGIVQLAGDLGGTAAAPTVPGLAERAVAMGGNVRIWAPATTFPSVGVVEGDLFPYVGE